MGKVRTRAPEVIWARPLLRQTNVFAPAGKSPPAPSASRPNQETPMRINFVLIDFENVQPEALAVLEQDHFKVIVFVGANQTKVPFETAAALQRLGGKAEYVKISGNGPNALDFHIAFYIGQLSMTEPNAYFHVVSKDTGFDPLIEHLKTKKVFAARVKNVADIPLVKAAGPKALEEKLEMVAARLQQMKAARPRTVKTLSSTIASLFQKQLGDDEIASLVQAIQAKGVVSVSEGKVTYGLPHGS